MKIQRYKVEGAGRFPIDMLRYDSAWPAQESDSYQIDTDVLNRRQVTLNRVVQGQPEPCDGRWQSFGWHVVKI